MPFLLNVILMVPFESQFQEASPQRIESRVSLILVVMGRLVVVKIQVWVRLKFNQVYAPLLLPLSFCQSALLGF